MKSIKPIALKKASILTNEEMKHLFGGSAATLTCTFSCAAGESVSATGCASCSAAENGGYCIYPTGSAALLLCASGSSNGDDSGTSGSSDDSGVFYA